MFNPQAANIGGSMKRQLQRIAGLCLPAAGRKAAGQRRKAAVARQQRSWRMKRQSQKAFFFLLLPLVTIIFCWIAYTLLLHSDIFRITDVTVQGNQVTTQQQVLKAAGLNRGTNLLGIDIPRIESSIRKEQWVDQVWVKRRWPSTVEIIVEEHKPFALINLERDGTRQLYYINRKGIVFAPSSAERDLDYPVVNGKSLAGDLQEKRFRENSLGAMALEFLKLTARGNQILPTQVVSEINVEAENGLIVYLVDHPFPIYMGKEKMQLRFNRLVRVLEKLYREDEIKGVTEIRMDYADDKILVARIDDAS